MEWSEVHSRAETFADAKHYDALTCRIHEHWGIGDFVRQVVNVIGELVAEGLRGECSHSEILDGPVVYLPNGDEADAATLAPLLARHLDAAIAACATDDELAELSCADCAAEQEREDSIYFYAAFA